MRVIYLVRAKRTWLEGNFTLEQATKQVYQIKKRGMTAWVVDDDGAFVPIPRVRSQPGFIP